MSDTRFVLRCATGLLLGATAACSFVGFDGFVGPPKGNDGGGAEPSGDVSQAPPEHTPDTDSGSQSATDGGGDAETTDPNGPPIFIDGGSFCTTSETSTSFCDDFDTTDLSVRWLREGVYGKLTSYSPKSAPNVFLLDVPPTNNGGTFVSKITKSFDKSSTNLVVSFDFKPERVNLGSSFFMLAALEWTQKPEAKYSLRLVYLSGSVRLEESNIVDPPNNIDVHHDFFTIPQDTWSHVTLDITASGGSPGAQVALDGVPVGGGRVSIAPTLNMDTRPTLILGAVYAANPHTGWTLRYDDVSVNFR